MAYIYPTRDAGIQWVGLGNNFVDARSATTGTTINTSNTIGRAAIDYISARGSSLGAIARAFFEFDTSGISVTPTYCKLELYGRLWTSGDLIAVKSTLTADADGGMSTADYDAIYNASTELAASDASGTGTLAGVSGLAYSSEISTWTTSGYNAITFNATALADMVSLDTFKVCVMEYDHDFLDIASLGDSAVSGWYTDAQSGTSRDPRLNYGAGVAATDNSIFFGCNF